MPKFFYRSLVSGLVLAFALQSSPIEADILPGNFLPNPSVEIDDDGDGIPDGWLKGGNNAAGDLWDTDDPVSGEFHLTLLDESETSYTSWYTNVMLPEDAEELTFQWTWKYEIDSENAGDEFRMSIAWRSEGSDISFNHVIVRDDELEYVTERMDWLVPLDADELRLEFVTAGPQTETGYMQIDDISIAITGQTVLGDFNANGILDADDIDMLTAEAISGNDSIEFDLNGDQMVDDSDRTVWVEEIRKTYFGDSNLDGEFSSADFVAVFTSAKYETGQTAKWSEGDWNGDTLFNSSDFVAAFVGAGYEQGPRVAAVQAVPEPTSTCVFYLGAMAMLGLSRRRTISRI
jgi:hypothetical protein